MSENRFPDELTSKAKAQDPVSAFNFGSDTPDAHNSFAFQAVHSTPSGHAYDDLRDTVLLSDCPFVYMSLQSQATVLTQHGLSPEHLTPSQCESSDLDIIVPTQMEAQLTLFLFANGYCEMPRLGHGD